MEKRTKQEAPPSTAKAVTLPSDLITLIALLFDSATDLLSFCLVCRHHYEIVLSKIKAKQPSKQSQQLLDLHRAKIIVIEEDEYGAEGKAHEYDYLPNSDPHGRITKWRLNEDCLSQLLDIAEADQKNRKDLGLQLFKPAEQYNNAVFLQSSEALTEAVSILQAESEIDTDGHKHFGKYEGLARTYYRYPDRVCEESFYRDGKLHGTQKTYNKKGYLEVSNELYDNVLHGFRCCYQDGMMTGRMPFSHGKIHGERESWDIITDQQNNWFEQHSDEYDEEEHERKPRYQVLVERSHYQNNAIDGVQETWDPSGIRTSLSVVSGQDQQWDPVTAEPIE